MMLAVRTFCIAMALLPSAVMAAELQCDIAAKFSCQPTGCEPNQLGVWNLVDIERERFSRCDRNGCDHYDATVSQSGVFYNIEVPGRGIIAKMSLDGKSYMEVATIGVSALISFGSCGASQ